MKVDQKISDKEVGTTLNFLANNWKQDPKLRAAIGAILEKLRVGSAEEQRSAEVLEDYLSYPGSEGALKVVTILHAAMRSQDGRRAAGLPPKTKGKTYSAELVRQDDEVLEELVKYELGKTSEERVEKAVINYLGANRDAKTIKKFTEELRPRAKRWADFQRFMVDAKKNNRPL